MVRTPEESRIESPAEIAKERQEVRELLARGELEASLTHVRDLNNGDMARFRLMRFGFVLDSISLSGTNPKRYFFNGHFPDTERKHMRDIMSSKVHAKLALALDAMNALRYDPGAQADMSAPDNFSRINRPLQD